MFDPLNVAASAKAANESLNIIGKFWRWLKSFHYPKPKSGKTGILLGITTENEQGQRQVKNDLIRSMRRRLEGPDKKFQIIEVPDIHLVNLEQDDKPHKLLTKCKCILLIYGLAKERNVSGQPYLVLETLKMATHNEIPKGQSDIFSREMSELIPFKILIPQHNNLISTELTGDGIGVASKYLSAIAVNLSGDIQKSISIFEELKKELQENRGGIANLNQAISHRVEMCLSAIYLGQARKYATKWRMTKNLAELDEMMNELNKISSEDKRYSYPAALLKATYYFVKEKDIVKARKLLEPWSSSLFGEWAFSLGFLHAFNGKLTNTKRFYDIALRREFRSEAILEIEDFIEWVLTEYPEKYELHYCLGRLQLEAKNERQFAEESFHSFLNALPPGKHLLQAKEVRQKLGLEEVKPIAIPESRKYRRQKKKKGGK